MPKRSGTTQHLVGATSGERFPASHDLSHGMTVHDFDDDVDMVRHEAPGEELIAPAVEVQKGILDQGCNVGATQPASPCAGVEPVINETDAIVLRQQSLDDCPRKAVGQAEGYELDRLGGIEMRKISAGVPAFGLHVRS
jgi:hypothetical protein